jgi:hypothetical protein
VRHGREQTPLELVARLPQRAQVYGTIPGEHLTG